MTGANSKSTLAWTRCGPVPARSRRASARDSTRSSRATLAAAARSRAAALAVAARSAAAAALLPMVAAERRESAAIRTQVAVETCSTVPATRASASPALAGASGRGSSTGSMTALSSTTAGAVGFSCPDFAGTGRLPAGLGALPGGLACVPGGAWRRLTAGLAPGCQRAWRPGSGRASRPGSRRACQPAWRPAWPAWRQARTACRQVACWACRQVACGSCQQGACSRAEASCLHRHRWVSPPRQPTNRIAPQRLASQVCNDTVYPSAPPGRRR